MAFKYSIGKNCSVVLLWAGVRYDISDVTGFKSQQEVKRQRVDPLNSIPVEFNVPSGWRGSFMVDRGSPVLDNLISAIETAFWTAGAINNGVIYTYILENDGSTTTYEYIGVSLELSDAGTYQAESTVKQTLSFFASQRNVIA